MPCRVAVPPGRTRLRKDRTPHGRPLNSFAYFANRLSAWPIADRDRRGDAADPGADVNIRRGRLVL